MLLYTLCSSAWWAGGAATATDTTAQTPAGAADYLEIYAVNSATCQALRRGKMRMLRNLHPTDTIHYRMTRILAGKRQAGMIRSTILPTGTGEDAQGDPLGCELLDGLRQEWTIRRAHFGP